MASRASTSKYLAITAGEPAGIGPDLLVQLAQEADTSSWVVIADADLLHQRAKMLGLALEIVDYAADTESVLTGEKHLRVLHVPLADSAMPGCLNPANAGYVLETLRRATDGCLRGEFCGMVTAPVHKGVINDAGVPFSGHTEFLAQRCHAPMPVMMLATDSLRVALATTHVPLRDVADTITQPLLSQVIRILDNDLRHHFQIANPRILVCGLNPHAGEGGHLGREEINVITPALDALRAEGIDLTGPLPADTLFTARYLDHADAVLSMFHDQGLPVLKFAGFGRAVNVTLGLPIVRTSVDHGTALELAGTGKAETGSLMAAIEMAAKMGHLDS